MSSLEFHEVRQRYNFFWLFSKQTMKDLHYLNLTVWLLSKQSARIDMLVWSNCSNLAQVIITIFIIKRILLKLDQKFTQSSIERVLIKPLQQFLDMHGILKFLDQ